MAYYTIGDLIRDVRERQKHSQEELSYGICTPSTLSRIENGLQVPGKKILEGLMQRLGIVDGVNNVYLSREELERYDIERQLVRSLGKEDYQEVERLAGVMEKRLKKARRKDYGMKMEEQYVKFTQVMVRKHKGEDAARVLEMLLDIIRMTIPDFDGIHIRERLLTFHEISILNNIGCAYHDMGELWNGMRLLFELKEYIEGHTPGGEEMSVKYPMILQNLSSWMGQERKYNDALQLCQIGIDYCIEHGKLHIFPMLLCNKACALAELGQYDLAKDCFLESIAILQAMNQHERAEQTRIYAKSHYGI